MATKKKKAKAPKAEAPKKKKVNAVDIIDRNGKYVRTYDVERHGENFMDLAEEFIREVKDAPLLNKGRKIVDHPCNGIVKVNVVNRISEKVVATFTEADGVDFREKANAKAGTIVEKVGKFDQIVGAVEEVKE